MLLALDAERLRPGIEPPECADELIVTHTQALPPLTERLGVRALHRAVAAVAATVVCRADRAAAGMGDRPEARRALRHHHAHRAAALALDADAVARDLGTALAK